MSSTSSRVRSRVSAVALLAAGPVMVAVAGAPSVAAECTIVGTVGPDVLVGTTGSDVICGLAGDDVLIGHDGDDNLVGGVGTDTADYGSATAPITASTSAITNPCCPSTVTGEGTGSDTISEIEGIKGTRFADRISGEVPLVVRAGPGDDLIGWNDTAMTPPVYGGAGHDQLRLDLTDWTDGALFHGGLGSDTIYLEYAHSSVRVDLAADTVTSRSGAPPVLRVPSTENANGALYGDDLLLGDGGPNLLIGHDGYDELRGRGGNDRLFAGAQDDILDGGSGADLCNGGEGSDSATGCETLRGVP